jgi:hypothetical protein
MTTCKLYVGCDTGNGLTKVAFSDDTGNLKVVKYPSYVIQVPMEDVANGSYANLSNGAIITYVSGPRKDLVDTSWLLGNTAYTNFPDTRRAVVESNDGKVLYGLQLFLGSLAMAGFVGRETIHIRLCVSVHNKIAFQKDIVEAYSGLHQIKQAESSQSIWVNISAACVEEGRGTIYYLIQKGIITSETPLAGLIDLGDGTTRASMYTIGDKSFTVIPESVKVTNTGVRNLLRRMANHSSLTEPLQSKVDQEIIRVSLENSAKNGMYYGNTAVGLTEAYQACLKEWLDSSVRPAISALDSWKAVAVIYTIGGGTQLPGIEKLLYTPNKLTGRPRFNVTPEPQLSNAIGLSSAAKRMEKA